MDIIDIRLPKSLLVSKKSSEIVPGLVVDEQGSVSLITWINSRITDGSISSIGGGSPSAAENISVTPSGDLTSTDVQAALLELQSDINNFSGGSSAAADITVVASGNLTSTNVQAALLELQGDINSLAGGGSDGNGIYDGNGTLTSTTTVNGDSNALVFNTLSNFQVTTLSSGFIMNTNEGIRYNADYSANFSARSLVDKAYVDAEVGSISASSTDGTMVVGDGSVGDPITLGDMGATLGGQVLAYNPSTGTWVPKTISPSPHGSVIGTQTSITSNSAEVYHVQSNLTGVVGRGWFYIAKNSINDPSFTRDTDIIKIDCGTGVNKLISASIHFNTSILTGTDLTLIYDTGSVADFSVRNIQIYDDGTLYDMHPGTVSITFDGFLTAVASQTGVTWTIANIDTLNDVIIVVS